MRTSMVLTLLLFANAAAAQIHGAVGVSASLPNYDTANEAFRITPGVEVLLERHRLGVHIAAEWTNRRAEGSVTALHTNVSWRVPFAHNWAFLIGAGSTRVGVEAGDQHFSTWNADLEAMRRFTRTEVFIRVRQYSYPGEEFRRQRYGGAEGPSIGAGIRVRLDAAARSGGE